MEEMFKIEGRVVNLQVKESVWSVFGNNTDKVIKTSTFFGMIFDSISLLSQTIYFSSKSKKKVHAYTMLVNNHVCSGKFHKVLFEENDYVICIAKKNDDGSFEPYAVLSPKTGLLHMQIEMGTAVKPHDDTIFSLAKFMLIIVMLMALFFSYISDESFWSSLLENCGIFLSCYIIFMLFFWIILRSSRHLAIKSESVFKMYGFDLFQELRLVPARYYDEKNPLILESVYEYRKIIKKDPYPETYITDK